MKKRMLILAGAVAVAALGGGVAQGHECTYDRDTGEEIECHETPVKPNWRDGNYVPLFDLQDRDDPAQRRDAQRWRDECQGYDAQGRYYNNQFCIWLEFGNSFGDAPNEVHAGSGGQHCFLFEFAHQCEGHDSALNEGVHDAHGGAAVVDVCLAENPENRYCDEGMAESQVGVTIMDHNPCGTVVPVVACTDEYHVVRPFDPDYTYEQQTDSVEYIGRIASDPLLYVCGYPQYGGAPWCPEGEAHEGGIIVPDPGITVGSSADAIRSTTDVTPMGAAEVSLGPVLRGASLSALDLPAPGSPRGRDMVAVWLAAAVVVALGLRARRVLDPRA